MDKIPSSFEYCLVLFSSALEFKDKEKIIMNNLIIDATDKKIFFMLMKDKNIYSVSHENSKTNYEKIVSLIDDFLNLNNLKIENISNLYVNRGPGSFAGIRNSISIIKAICLVMKVDYYCYSSQYFKNVKEIKYENIPYLCDKFNVKKNLINPIYIS